MYMYLTLKPIGLQYTLYLYMFGQSWKSNILGKLIFGKKAKCTDVCRIAVWYCSLVFFLGEFFFAFCFWKPFLPPNEICATLHPQICHLVALLQFLKSLSGAILLILTYLLNTEIGQTLGNVANNIKSLSKGLNFSFLARISKILCQGP